MTQLVLDVGNSAVKAGVFEGGRLQRTARFARPADAAAAWRAALAAALPAAHPSRAALASVVPTSTPGAAAALEALTGAPPLVAAPGLQLPFAVGYETPETLGTDRLAAAVAAWMRYGRAAPRTVVALDAGTAVTYEVIAANGVYHGGPIAPGPELLRAALHRGTAQLPEVPLEWPARRIGRSTREALQSGVMHGFVDAVDGMLRRLEADLGARPFVVATGGWADLLAAHLPRRIDAAAPHLVLEGLQALLELNP